MTLNGDTDDGLMAYVTDINNPVTFRFTKEVWVNGFHNAVLDQTFDVILKYSCQYLPDTPAPVTEYTVV